MTDATSIQPFDFNGAEVRVVTIEGNPWWIAADVCAVLGYAHGPSAIRRLDDDEYSQVTPNVRPGHSGPPPRPVTIVNEPGLYSLILGSAKPEAKAFKRWVTHDVLPELRRNGRYEVEPINEIEFARRYLAAVEEKERVRLALEAAQPKVEAFDQLMDADGTYSMATVAQMCGSGQNRLYATLRQRGVLISGGDRHNTPYQQYAELFKVVPGTYKTKTGETKTSYTTKVKPGGLEFIRRMLGTAEAA